MREFYDSDLTRRVSQAEAFHSYLIDINDKISGKQ